MAFDHVSTFLRSTLVRDPFALGDLISPEDVLRLEEKYPALFDKPSNPSSTLPEDAQERSVKEKAVNTSLSSCDNANLNLPSPLKPKTLTKAKINKNAPPPPRPPVATQMIGSLSKKPTVSQFHRKCLESTAKHEEHPVRQRKASPQKSVNRVENVAVERRQKTIIKPSKTFSLEDLREALKQIMEKEKETRGKKSQPSPYTEDLVKKFLGRKLEELEAQRRKYARSAEPSRHDTRPKTAKSQLKYYPLNASECHSEYCMVNNRGQDHKPSGKGKVHGVRSVPGFLRGISDLPPTPLPNFNKRKKSCSKSSSPDKSKNDRGESSTPRNNSKQVSWAREELEESSISSFHSGLRGRGASVVDGSGDHAPSRPDSNEDKHQFASPRRNDGRSGTQIFLRSIRSMPVEGLPAPPTVVRDSRFPSEQSSTFRQLAVRAQSAKFDKKSQLRKEESQNNFAFKEMQRDSRKFQKSRRYENSRRFPLSTKEEFMVDPASVQMKTQDALKKIAEELVHMEILHQLREIRQEQETQEAANLDEPEEKDATEKMKPGTGSKRGKGKLMPSSSDESEKSLPKFVPTTDYETESRETCSKKHSPRSPSPSAIVLKTPDLTPPTAKSFNRKQVQLETLPDKKEEIVLNTPDLSPSPRKVAARKLNEMKAAKQQVIANVETDCSEMSDFVATEPQIIDTPERANLRSQSLIESIKLDTPRLSRSYTLEKPQFPVDEEPEKDKSTLSGVSSFHESQVKSDIHDQDNAVNIAEKENDYLEKSQESQNVPSKYSDDFIAENNSSAVSLQASREKSHFTPIASNSHFSSNVENELEVSLGEEDVIDNLNVSGETVIDLLSEGEFIGTSYRSPGELSVRRGAESSSGRVTVEEKPSVFTNLGTESQSESQDKESSLRERVNSEISHISSGAQVIDEVEQNVDISMGECLVP